jgi:ssDNA-binding Zn-finger/Zn-ribbon topoisomerase 1
MSKCKHEKAKEVGETQEGLGNIILEWCPQCGALKRTMTNWKYTKGRWKLPKDAKSGGTQ